MFGADISRRKVGNIKGIESEENERECTPPQDQTGSDTAADKEAPVAEIRVDHGPVMDRSENDKNATKDLTAQLVNVSRGAQEAMVVDAGKNHDMDVGKKVESQATAVKYRHA
ncbi:hypothetical protein MRX96_046033 [Rhipicephalus microplus]